MKRRRRKIQQQKKTTILMLSLLKKCLIGSIFVLISLFLTLFIYLFYSWQKSPLVQSQRLHLVHSTTDGETTQLILLSTKKKQSFQLKLDPKLSVPVLSGYQFYDNRALLPLSKQENKFPELWLKSLSHWLSIDINQYLISSKSELTLDQVLLSQSSLTLAEKTWLFWKLNRLQPQHYSLDENSTKLDPEIEKNVAIDSATDQSLQVAIVNTTGETGLASELANKFNSLGVDIVSLRDDQEMLEKSQVITNSDIQLSNRFTGILTSFMPNDTYFFKDDTSKYRADIVIKLAKDYHQLKLGRDGSE